MVSFHIHLTSTTTNITIYPSDRRWLTGVQHRWSEDHNAVLVGAALISLADTEATHAPNQPRETIHPITKRNRQRKPMHRRRCSRRSFNPRANKRLQRSSSSTFAMHRHHRESRAQPVNRRNPAIVSPKLPSQTRTCLKQRTGKPVPQQVQPAKPTSPQTLSWSATKTHPETRHEHPLHYFHSAVRTLFNRQHANRSTTPPSARSKHCR